MNGQRKQFILNRWPVKYIVNYNRPSCVSYTVVNFVYKVLLNFKIVAQKIYFKNIIPRIKVVAVLIA